MSGAWIRMYPTALQQGPAHALWTRGPEMSEYSFGICLLAELFQNLPLQAKGIVNCDSLAGTCRVLGLAGLLRQPSNVARSYAPGDQQNKQHHQRRTSPRLRVASSRNE